MSEVWFLSTPEQSSKQKTNNFNRQFPPGSNFNNPPENYPFITSHNFKSDNSFLGNSNGSSNREGEYSLFSSDGLPPPSRSNESIAESWGGFGKLRKEDGFSLADLSYKLNLNTEIENNDRDRLAAAIWSQLPDKSFSDSFKPVSKAVGAELHETKSARNALEGRNFSSKPPSPHFGKQNDNVGKRIQYISGPQQNGFHAHPLHQIQTSIPAPNAQLLTLIPNGVPNSNVVRSPVNTLIQPHVIGQTFLQIPPNNVTSMPQMSNVIGSGVSSQNNRSARLVVNKPEPVSVTAPQLHTVIGQINEITIHALNQTASMIMDRKELESKLLQYAPDQFRSVYNELALPEPMEPVSGKKDLLKVDMLLTAQLRENLRINTLVCRIKVAIGLSPSGDGSSILEKWTEDVRALQSFLMKMNERARRLRLSTTIAATLYSNGDMTSGTSDSTKLANLLGDVMTSTLCVRQVLFQLGEQTLAQLMGSFKLSVRNAAVENSLPSSPLNVKPQSNPVNPESAKQLWSQLGQSLPF